MLLREGWSDGTESHRLGLVEGQGCAAQSGATEYGEHSPESLIVIVALGAVLADAKPFPVNALPKTASPKLRAAPGGWLELSLCPHLINEGGRPKVT